eukprot:TRINITY_DN14393_c0_g1_i2.p2 TRINITY_DN14393_c0_g1~~TRINITY_DN14393_c0_g1_i2.p2  ORF type:complete len:103 (+),score=1.21 TRINITY_DN14393_c0_g1_i2:63-371(+)
MCIRDSGRRVQLILRNTLDQIAVFGWNEKIGQTSGANEERDSRSDALLATCSGYPNFELSTNIILMRGINFPLKKVISSFVPQIDLVGRLLQRISKIGKCQF